MNWWNRLRQRRRLEQQLDRELAFHLEQHTSDLIASGQDAQEARRLARLALGGPEQVKEECRDARGTRWLEDFWQDFRYSVRTLRQRPGFTVVALLTLALGTGATTVMFTVIDGVLLKALPFPEPDRLIAVHGHSTTWNVALFGQQNLAYLDFLDTRHEIRSMELTGWLNTAGTVSAPGDAEYVDEKDISSNLFSVLGVPLFRGRAFLPEEDRPGAASVAILSYSFWQRHFGGNPDALGMPLVLDGNRYTIVGIAPPDFRPYGDEAEVYTPLGQNRAKFLQNRRAHPITTVARLRPGATLSQARTELAAISRRLAGQYPDTNQDRSFIADPLRPNVGNVRSTLWLLLGAVTLVLLIACANIASLLLARSVARERELAMRMALGAGKGRLIRQCLTESAVLALGGGVLGILLAAAGVRPFVAFWPGTLPRAHEVQLDWRVLLFTAGVSLSSGIFFGIIPALRAPKREMEQALRAGARSVLGNTRRLHGAFVIAEIAIAVVLLVSAGMLGRTLLRLSSLHPGVNVRNVLVTRMALSPSVLTDASKTRAAWEEILRLARQVPGVQSIAIVDTVPMRQGNNQLSYWTTAAVPPENRRPFALATCVGPDYLKVMGIPLRRGRFFDNHDRSDTGPVIVIDEVLAQSAFGGLDPIGKRLWIPDMGSNPLTIVGVVGHVRHWGLAGDDQAPVRAQFYYPWSQVADPLVRRWSELMSIAVRTSVPPLSVVAPLRRALRGSANDQVLYQVRTLDQLAANTLAPQRFLMLLFGIFAGLALLLACIGIYGVLAYLTSQRIPEIGVRMALGASAHQVLRMVMKHSLGLIAIGIGVGLAGALAAARVLIRLVEGVRSTEVSTFAAMISTLVVAALFASFLPARRASRIDPMTALRQE